MNEVFLQGYLDSLCGVYSIINAEKLINGSSTEQSQRIFNRVIKYLNTNHTLCDNIIGGTDYVSMLDIIESLLGNKMTVFKSRKQFDTIDDWWNYSLNFILEPTIRTIILSIGGREDHVTVVKSMSDKSMILLDSGGIKQIRRSTCELKGYTDKDRYIIFPYQCIYLMSAKGE